MALVTGKLFGGNSKHLDFLKKYVTGKAVIPEKIPAAERQLMSDIYQMAEKWIIIKHALRNHKYSESVLLQYFRQKEDEKLFYNFYTNASKSTDDNLKNGDYYRHASKLLFERWQFDQLKSRFSNADAEEILENDDVALISHKLMQIVSLAPQLSLISKRINTAIIDILEPYILEKNYLQYPCIALYYYTLNMIRYPDDTSWFEKFSNDLEHYEHQFPEDELKNLYFQAINYCIRKHNSGEREYSHRLLDYYKKALSGGYLLINGHLSRNTYRNINTIALRIGLDQEAEEISNTYVGLLRKKDMKSAYHFNMASIFYTRKSYDRALEALRYSEFDDHLSNLFAKTLMLKIYYEMGEERLLDAHLDAMQVYLTRKKDIGYHKTSYDKIVKYTRKLININRFDSSHKEKLNAQISAEKVLPDKDWLLRQLAAK